MKRILALALLPLAAWAHVGSPDVFMEDNAGPYRLLVVVRTPRVIPGLAGLEVRALSGVPQTLRIVPLRIQGLGSELAPAPDIVQRDAADPGVFRAQVWIMLGGAWKVRIQVQGDRGSGELSVPIAAVSMNTREMEPPLRWLLIGLLTVLSVGLVGIAGGAVREGNRPPGRKPSPSAIGRARRAMLIAAVLLGAALWGGRSWWRWEVNVVSDRVYKPPVLQIVTGQNTLELKIQRLSPATTVSLDDVVPDHGHLMHLFLVRSPSLDRLFHLHPDKHGDTFVQQLPSMPAGHYQVFGDIVHNSGFPETAVGEITLPDIPGRPPQGDDSSATAPAIGGIPTPERIAPLENGDRMVWLNSSGPVAGEATWLRFRVEDPSGRPATDLEPYMGMAAHLAVIRQDRTVFAHLHPSGSAPMAAIELANGSSMPHNMRHSGITADLAFPYGFPQPGLYRLFVQVKQAGHIETAAFDRRVAESPAADIAKKPLHKDTIDR